jgi:hypothetical protein
MTRIFPRIPVDIWYVVFAFIVLGLSFIFVPRKNYRSLFYEGMIFGTLFSWVIISLLTALKLFHYRIYGPFAFMNNPIWLNLAWAPAIIIFLYFKPPMRSLLPFWGYLLSFSFLSAAIDRVLHNMGLLEYLHWSPAYRFVFSLLWFFAVSYLHEKVLPRWEWQD